MYSYGTVALRLVRLIFAQRTKLRDFSRARPVFVKSPISLEALNALSQVTCERGHPKVAAMSRRSIPALLAGDYPRSELDPEVEAEAAATSSIAMHPVTGAFADPTHELAFAAQFFRLSFRGHVLLIALPIAVLIVTGLSV